MFKVTGQNCTTSPVHVVLTHMLLKFFLADLCENNKQQSKKSIGGRTLLKPLDPPDTEEYQQGKAGFSIV